MSDNLPTRRYLTDELEEDKEENIPKEKFNLETVEEETEQTEEPKWFRCFKRKRLFQKTVLLEL